MENKSYADIESFENFLIKEKMVLAYFSSKSCNVCKVLKPKIKELIRFKFPKIKSIYIDIEENSVLCGQLLIFSIPTIILYIEGKESGKFSRNVSLQQLEDIVGRFYDFIN